MARPKKPPQEAAARTPTTPLQAALRDRVLTLELVEALIPYARNSRTHTDEQVAEIAASIREFGFTNPVLIRGTPPTIVAGHARVLAARKLGLERVPCIRLDDLTEVQARAYVIADNRLAEKAGWDFGTLELEFDELAAAGFSVEATGFDMDAQRDVRRAAAKARAGDAGGQPGEDVYGTIPVDPITRPGDVWHIGRHRLACADSLEPGAVKELAGDMQVHLVATDPPYAIYGSATGMASDIADDKMVRPFFESVLRVARDSLPWFGHLYVFCDWRSYATLVMAARRIEPLALKNMLVWDKGGSGMGAAYTQTHELIAFFAKLPPQNAMGHREAGARVIYKPNVLRHNRPHGDDRQHNAAKPVALMRELIENSTGPGDVVLEPCAGSGSTMVAADQLGRTCIAFDVEPKWCDVIVGRMAKLRELDARLGGPDGPTYKEIASQRTGDDHAAVKH